MTHTPHPTTAADFTLPDYSGGSLVNLMRGVADACGAAPLPYAPLAGLDAAALGATRTLVLLVIDGLGYHHLMRRGAGSVLRRHLVGRLTSVFPSTTASAITTFLTGLAPQQHALTGWHLYFREVDRIVAPLPLQPRAPGGAPVALPPERLFAHGNLFDRLSRPSWAVAPASIVHSPFNVFHTGRATRVAYTSVAEMFLALAALARRARAPQFLYAYYPEIDADAHAHGIASEAVAARFAALDAAFGLFLDALAGSDTTVLVSADHGFIDAPAARRIDLARHPRLAAMLARPLCGERRVAYGYVRPGQHERFEAYVRERLAHGVALYPSRTLIAQGWFGPGAPHPELASRIGDYTLVMKDDWTIKDWMPGEQRHRQIGVHAGLSADEMIVPLIVARA
jgi:hypothetical protein